MIGIASNGGQGFGICTGTLISPNVVLTAQHCVSPTLNDTQGVDCSQTRPGTLFAADSVFITFETRMPFRAEGYYAVKEITVPDGEEFCGRDIAIMVLQDPVDPSLLAPALPRVDLDIVKGEIYSAVGYGGDDSGSWDASGRRRRRDDLFVECRYDQCSLRYQFAMRDTEFLGDTGVCQGDSGGPALDAEGRVIGWSPVVEPAARALFMARSTAGLSGLRIPPPLPRFRRVLMYRFGLEGSQPHRSSIILWVTHAPTAVSVLQVSAKRACALGSLRKWTMPRWVRLPPPAIGLLAKHTRYDQPFSIRKR